MRQEEAVCLAVLFFYVIPRHAYITIDKVFNLFDECASRYVHLTLRKKGALLLPEGTVKCTLLAACA